MCTVSYVGDAYRKKWWPDIDSQPGQIWPQYIPTGGPTKAEFEALKKEIKELKKLLKAAKIFDESTNQKDCEMEEKIALLKKLAEAVGINLDDVFVPKTPEHNTSTVVIPVVTSGVVTSPNTLGAQVLVTNPTSAETLSNTAINGWNKK